MSTIRKITSFVVLLAATVALGALFWFLFYPHDLSNRSITSLDTKAKLSSLLDKVDTVLFDCDGVLYISDKALEGAADFVTQVTALGKKVLIVTNSSTRSRKSVLDSLARMGFNNLTLSDIVTTTYLTAIYLQRKNITEKVYVFGGDGIKEELDSLNVLNLGVGPEVFETSEPGLVPANVSLDTDIEAVVVGYDKHISLPKLIKAISHASRVRADLFVATNLDKTFLSTQPGLVVPGSGPFVNFIASTAGRKPVVMGKPSRLFWDTIVQVFPSIDPMRTLMVGDQLDTDIAFARMNGLQWALLVGMGRNMSYDDALAIEDDNFRPDYFVNSLNDLRSLI